MEWIFLLVVILLAYHISTLGNYYIEYTGQEYYVWQKAFMGYNDLRGRFETEELAREAIEKLRANPPRKIGVS